MIDQRWTGRQDTVINVSRRYGWASRRIRSVHYHSQPSSTSPSSKRPQQVRWQSSCPHLHVRHARYHPPCPCAHGCSGVLAPRRMRRLPSRSWGGCCRHRHGRCWTSRWFEAGRVRRVTLVLWRCGRCWSLVLWSCCRHRRGRCGHTCGRLGEALWRSIGTTLLMSDERFDVGCRRDIYG